MKKIIIIGGLGYIGSVLKLECEKEGLEAVIIDNNLYGLASSSEKFINCDILSKEALGAILKNLRAESDCIINLAAVVGDPACLVNTKEALEINCLGTRNVVELANEYNYKIIHASTCSLYGSEKKSVEAPLHEDSFVFPIDFYGQTKYQQERFVVKLASNFCIFRLGTAYGLSPRMRYDLVVNLFSAKVANDELLTIYGGEQFRPFTHISDISRAFIFAYKNNLSGIYNLAGENLSIRNIANIFRDKYDAKLEVMDLIDDPRNYNATSAKLLSTGFSFIWNLDAGIVEMVNFSKGVDYSRDTYNQNKLMQKRQLDESKILITGGSGRLGKACKKIITKAQYPSSQVFDLGDEKSINDYFLGKKINTVVHFAALTGIPDCENNKAKAYDVNVLGMRRLLEAAKNNGVKHFIYLNTACVFPGTDDELMEDEDSIPYPKHYYGLTKLLAEEIAKTYNSADFQVTIVRTNFTSMPWEYPKAFTDRFGTYLFAQGVAKGIRDVIVEKPAQSIIHICGDRKISMYDYAKLGGSEVTAMTLADYHGPALTKNMSITSKYWRLYRLEDSDFNDN